MSCKYNDGILCDRDKTPCDGCSVEVAMSDPIACGKAITEHCGSKYNCKYCDVYDKSTGHCKFRGYPSEWKVGDDNDN